MARVCQVTGKRALVGNKVSHSNIKTKRRYEVNLRRKRYFLEDEGRWVTLRVSTKGMRVIDKRGIGAVVKELRARGEKI